MGEASLRRRRLCVPTENAELVGHGGPAEALHPDPDLDGVGKGHAFEEGAGVRHHEAHGFAGGDVERAAIDQHAVHRRVEEAVVDDVVHVAIDVIVRPARGDKFKMAEIGAVEARFAGLAHQKAAS